MTRGVRRIVTGHDAAGKAIVTIDGDAPNVKVREVGGIVSTLLWVLDSAPAKHSNDQDLGNVAIGTAPPPQGAVFRIVDFPPVTEELDEAANQRMKAAMGIAHDDAGAPARHAFMHRTKSVDFAIILDGEIDMLLDDSEVHCRAGDVMVQQGTNHAWVNRGSETCRIAFVLIDAVGP
jgi:mannose-6-phosphate isomerase-like protein (cupin superfamily)